MKRTMFPKFFLLIPLLLSIGCVLRNPPRDWDARLSISGAPGTESFFVSLSERKLYIEKSGSFKKLSTPVTQEEYHQLISLWKAAVEDHSSAPLHVFDGTNVHLELRKSALLREYRGITSVEDIQVLKELTKAINSKAAGTVEIY